MSNDDEYATGRALPPLDPERQEALDQLLRRATVDWPTSPFVTDDSGPIVIEGYQPRSDRDQR